MVFFRDLTLVQQEKAKRFGYDPSFPTADDMEEGNEFVKKAVQDSEVKCPSCETAVKNLAGRFVLLGVMGMQRLVNRRCIKLVLDDEDDGPKILLPGVVV